MNVLEAQRRRLGFLLCGDVLMPDHGHALIWAHYPLRIEAVRHDAKKIMTLRLPASAVKLPAYGKSDLAKP